MTRGNNVFAKIVPIPRNIPRAVSTPPQANDIFLYSLFARVTLTNNDVIEFQTQFDQATNTIELIIPNEMQPLLNQITGMQRGPNFQTFINWLIGSQNLAPATTQDKDFVPASAIEVWFGANNINISGTGLVLSLPQAASSTVGYNLKVSDSFSGRLVVSLVWMFIEGCNDNFTIQTSCNLTDQFGGNPTYISDDTDISTLNLISGDIRETIVLDTGLIVSPNNIAQLLFSRNYAGSPDPRTELVGIVGIRLQLLTT